ncbi:MAG: DUF4174 domain-containing protein [Chloroflexota bacterium]
MKNLSFTAILSAAALLSMACTFDEVEQEGLKTLDGFQWESRILLIFSGETNGQTVAERFRNDEFQVADRDLIWFVFDKGKVISNFSDPIDSTFAQGMATQYQKSADGSLEIVLIGKDGDVKYRSDELDTSEIYFEIIDVMPMRRSEMRENG